MAEFKVGDKVTRIEQEKYFWSEPGEVHTVSRLHSDEPTLIWLANVPGDALRYHELCVEVAEIRHVQAQVVGESTETLHPVAEKPARKNLRQRMQELFSDGRTVHHNGWTGSELATQLEAKLNSVTPRFAELRKAGIIKAHEHMRRNGETVWVQA